MKPIQAPKLLEKGIAVFVPALENYSHIKLEIFYSPKNPLFSWSFCEESPFKIWEKNDVSYDAGIAFLYKTTNNLDNGFYKIMITATSNGRDQQIRGSQTYGILNDKETLYIGFPYSTFAPISLS